MAVNLLIFSSLTALFACTVIDATSISLPIDCRLVRCLNPVCKENETSVVLPGNCCPTCQPKDTPVNCTGAGCPTVVCPINQVLSIPKGECCGRCKIIDKCFGIPCALPLCAGNTRPIVPEGECCPKCLPDCSAVLCFKPECEEPGTLVTPPGECCPKCQPDCSAVSCLRPECEPGEVLVTPDGECCPKCQVDCSAVLCFKPECEEPGTLVTPPGECCPKCQPDCSAVSCLRPECEPGEVLVTPDGECCPKCQVDCSAVLCFKPECEEPGTLVTPPGECCPKCQPDCSAVSCLRPECEPGEVLVTPDGECCPKCQVDCSAVLCFKPECEEPGTLVTPPGECCPKCQPDCSAVSCLRPECEPREILVTPDGECCPKCQLDCALVADCALPVCTTGERAVVPEGKCCPVCVRDPTCAAVSCVVPVCPAGQVAKVPEGECCAVCVCEIEGQTFSQCASACPRSCESPNIFCRAQCRPGCQCPPNQVIDTVNKRCVPLEECPAESCPVRGQIRSPCAGCDTTCAQFINQELVICPAVCRIGGCTCPPGQVIDTLSNECFTPDECPNACEIKKCQPGSRCKVFEPTGEAFCEPSCDIDNGGCPAGQSCTLLDVQCVRAPCPPVVQCMDTCALPAVTGPCDGAFPRYFHNATSEQCERFIFGGCGGNENNFETLKECESQCEQDICTLPAETGHCRAYIPRYFYNSRSKQCERFIYGGCGGNDNNFETLEECESRCEEDICSLSPETGPCRARIPRYFHNATSGQCELLIYGGCQGNDNNFRTLNECESRCEDPCETKECQNGASCEIFEPTGEAFCAPSCDIDNGGCPAGQSCSMQVVQCVRAPCPPLVRCTDICALPADPGPCEALIPRYFHNATSRQCERFTYGGCRGNENNFRTLKVCRTQCNVSSSPCDKMSCPDGSRCEVFNNEEAFCQPDCSLNNGGCAADETCRLEDVVCVRAPCPPHRVCESNCPPTCSKEFCLANSRKPCSDPGPREIPGCRGRCQFSYCKACYVGDEPIFPPPGNCTLCNLSDYTSNTKCYRKWARCTRRAHRRRFGKPDFTSDKEFRCYRPSCPLRG